jgi:hypothetical protein
MAKAVKSVARAVSGAVKTVTKAVTSVVQAAASVVEKVVDKVVEVAANVIQNPLPILETVALTYALGPAGLALGSSIGVTTTTMAAAVSSATVTAANGGNVQQVATSALATYVAANPGLSGQEKIVASGAIQLATGAKPEDVIRNVIASTASNTILPTVLKDLNAAVANQFPDAINQTVKSALINAERQAVAATITGQDVSQAALAGFAGGTVGDLAQWGAQVAAPKMEDVNTKSIGIAAGEYAQYKVAGYSDEQALNKAVQGVFSIQAQAAAKAELAKKTAGLSAEQVMASQSYGQTAGFPSAQSGQFTGTEAGGKSLAPQFSDAPATVGENLSVVPGVYRPSAFETRTGVNLKELPMQYSTKKESLPGGTTTATSGEDLSLIPTVSAEKIAAPTEKTPEQQRRETILTSLINKQVDTPLYNNKRPVAQQSGLGTAALAQALRVGDVGAPIFGRDEEGKKAGWNLESLRYMGDVGA